MNERFQNAIARIPQKTPPIWFMRQAGRYHSHYQSLRKNHSFLDLCRVPELAAETAMGPIRDFDFDVAILFSDLLFPLDALGLGLSYAQDGPKLARRLDSETIKSLAPIESALPQLNFQKLALQATRSVLPKSKSLIGFVGGAWTLFAYAAEGGHSGNLLGAKKQLSLFPAFCELLLPLLEGNISLQIEGGAEIVMVFDTAAGELSPALYHHYVLPTMEKLIRKFPGRLGYYAKGITASHLHHPFFDNPALGGFGLDHRFALPEIISARKSGFLQGNFDQALLHLSREDFKIELDRYLEPWLALSPEQRAGWVCGLGHGVLPATPEENIRSFVATVREHFS